MYEYRDRVSQLQNAVKDNGVDFYIIPLSDYHNSEIPNEYYNIIKYVTGFTGSNATLLSTRKATYLWTDGRYFIQAEKELEGTGIILMKMGLKGVSSVEEFLDYNMREDSVLAFDGKAINVATYKKYSDTLLRPNANRHICDVDIANELWGDRGSLKLSDIWVLSKDYAGESMESKVKRIRENEEFKKADALIVSDLCDIAWTLNLRGDDINHVKVFYSYLIITKENVILYVNKSALSDEAKKYLNKSNIIIREYNDIYDDLSNSMFYQLNDIYKMLIDESSLNTSLYSLIAERIEVLSARSIIGDMKCIKNETEINNIRNAHIKDGVAVTKFMYFLKKTIDEREEGKTDSSYSDTTSHTELSLANKLHEFRAGQEGFLDESFDTISAWAENGAIVHYEPTEDTDTAITNDNFLLVDSGGHYIEGTTDITRTFIIGKPSPKMVRDYTLVLKSNINLAMARFLKGTSGKSLDMLSRNVLWKENIDFLHGTGHGVGYILSVHEGPNNLSVRSPQDISILPGMVTTDEPGIYLEGEYGIRLENELLCVEDISNECGDFLKFECLALVPFDVSCIDVNMLTEDERNYLNEYHKKVYEMISPHLSEAEAEWFLGVTKEI